MKKPLIDKDCVAKLEAALKYELGHFYLYKHLAICMQAYGYFGAAAYFEKESAEENGHAQKHIQFLNDMGVKAKLPTLSPAKEDAETLYDAIELAYENEKDLLDYYKEAYKDSLDDAPVMVHLADFVKFQTDAVGFLGDILATMESEKENKNVCMVIDHKLKKLAKNG